MAFRILFNVDAIASVGLHALKAVVALALNWLILHRFSVDNFVVWSVTSSILVVATASDLGIGQYTVTTLISADPRQWPRHLGDSLGALAPLALLSGVFVAFTIDGPSRLYVVGMAALLALRIVGLPFIAVLHAKNQFKVRKAIELVAYLAAAVVVGGIALTGQHVYLALMLLNASFLFATSLMVVAASFYVSWKASLRSVSLRASVHLFRAALPFTVNNLTGLLTYGGFVWLSSLVLPASQVAKVAVLHSFVLVNLYQLYDVFLKARQADLADDRQLPAYAKLNIALMLLLPPLFFMGGQPVVALLSGKRLAITSVEAALYGVFVAAELGNLYVQSITQVNIARAGYLRQYSVFRAAMVGAYLLVGFLPLQKGEMLPVLFGILSLGSMASFAYLTFAPRSPNHPVPSPAPLTQARSEPRS
jgi:hypothetical protein